MSEFEPFDNTEYQKQQIALLGARIAHAEDMVDLCELMFDQVEADTIGLIHDIDKAIEKLSHII